MRFLLLSLAAASIYLAAGCAPENDPATRGGDRLGDKADSIGSCVASCNGQSQDGGCWCDDQCADCGDCCDDIEAVCGGSPEPEACPILTFECATGCCKADPEQVSTEPGNYADIAVDAAGNVYLAYALPNGGLWRTAVSIRDVSTGTWLHKSYSGGSLVNQIELGSTGRIHHLMVRAGFGITSPYVEYRFSDDLGVTWTEPANLNVNAEVANGAGCHMDIDAEDHPHLVCSSKNTELNKKLRYVSWDGSNWHDELISLNGLGTRIPRIQLGYLQRPHLVYPDALGAHPLRYARSNGTVWVSEPVPLPPSIIKLNPSRTIGFILSDNDTAHVVYSGQAAGGWETWHATRDSSTETWTLEQVLYTDDLMSSVDTTMAMTSDGRLVVFTTAGIGAIRHDDGTWHTITSQAGDNITTVAEHDDKLYVAFRGAKNLSPMFVDVVDIVDMP